MHLYDYYNANFPYSVYTIFLLHLSNEMSLFFRQSQPPPPPCFSPPPSLFCSMTAKYDHTSSLLHIEHLVDFFIANPVNLHNVL